MTPEMLTEQPTATEMPTEQPIAAEMPTERPTTTEVSTEQSAGACMCRASTRLAVGVSKALRVLERTAELLAYADLQGCWHRTPMAKPKFMAFAWACDVCKGSRKLYTGALRTLFRPWWLHAELHITCNTTFCEKCHKGELHFRARSSAFTV